MAARRRIDLAERRARLAVRHRLAPSARAATADEVADALVALHATDPATVHLSIAVRTEGTTPADVETALYSERTLMRMLGMRRTVFVVPDEVAPVVQAACTRAVLVRERASLLKLLRDHDESHDAAWLSDLEDRIHQLLLDKGPATGAELAAAEPRLRTQVTYAPGKSYSQTGAITTRVLTVLAAQGRIVRGRPVGSWVSSRHQWSAVEQWLPGGMPDLPLAEAQAELARRWLATFGPGTAADLKWWAGWTMSATRAALAAVGAEEVDLEGGTTGYVLPEDSDEVPEVEPWAAFLPALDPTPMGWSDRAWYLGDHAPALFDRTGNIGPTIWWNGRIVGGWAQRPNGEIALRLLEDPGTEATQALETERNRLATWLGPTRVTPRFRTPLERHLSTP